MIEPERFNSNFLQTPNQDGETFGARAGGAMDFREVKLSVPLCKIEISPARFARHANLPTDTEAQMLMHEQFSSQNREAY